MSLGQPSDKLPTPRKVAVIGNSNSVMRESYVHALEKSPHLRVINRSIGSSPNVVLLDYIALEQDWDFDYIIVETAVVDFLQSGGSYSAERSVETLELFITYVRERSAAEIVLLTIPTRLALLAPGTSWQESVYQGVADRFGLPILDGFNLIRALVGRRKAALAGICGSRASRLVQAFGLDMSLAPFIAWRELRDNHVRSNALGTFSFADHAHLSPSLHALIATLVAAYIHRSEHSGNKCSKGECSCDLPIVIAAAPHGGAPVSRTSSLISRELVKLVSGESAAYRCPRGFLAYGLMVNKAATCCFLHFQSVGGSTTFDLRFPTHATSWTAIVVANLDPVGDGDVVVSVLDQPETRDPVRQVPDTRNTTERSSAEIGELILVRSDWRNVLPIGGKNGRTAFHIDAAPWAKSLIAAAADSASQIVDGITLEHHLIDALCFKAAANMLSNRVTPLSAAEQARLMLLLGMTSGLIDFVDDAYSQNPGDGDLGQMQTVLQLLKAEDEVGPEDLLERAQALVRSQPIFKADRILADGMARFPGDIRFFIESAWVAHRQRNWIEAMRRWQNVVDFFPDHHVGYLGMVSSLSESGDLNAADGVLTSATARFPDNAEVARHHALHELKKVAHSG